MPDKILLTEDEFDRLVGIVPKMTALQLWNVADTFDRRIVALPKGGATDTETDTEIADQDGGNELRIGFRGDD